MTTKRLAILLVVMLAGFSAVFALPQQLGFQPVGIDMNLPEFLGEWWGQDVGVTQKERDTLGADTEFARKTYTNGSNDNVLTSIVLAGQDMMTGLHRPERCLNAQGWTVGEASRRVANVPNFGTLPLTRLHNTKRVVGPDGKPRQIDSVCYYFFVGANEVTATHGSRVWIDSRDRVLHGYNQRWAMVFVSAEITKDRTKFGRDEAQVDVLLKRFVEQIAPKFLTDKIRPS